MLNWEVIPRSVKMMLLDHDDTQVRTIPAKWAAHKLCARTHYDKTLTDEDLRMSWGLPLPVMCGLLYGDDDYDKALARYMSMQHQFPKELFEDTPLVLRELREAGLKVGVLTATTRESLADDWSKLGLDPEAYDYTQAYEDSDFHKPDYRVYDPFLAWLEVQHIRPDDVVCVGDGFHDQVAAVGAGFHFVGVSTGLVTPAQFSEVGVAAVGSLGGLLA